MVKSLGDVLILSCLTFKCCCGGGGGAQPSVNFFPHYWIKALPIILSSAPNYEAFLSGCSWQALFLHLYELHVVYLLVFFIGFFLAVSWHICIWRLKRECLKISWTFSLHSSLLFGTMSCKQLAALTSLDFQLWILISRRQASSIWDTVLSVPCSLETLPHSILGQS